MGKSCKKYNRHKAGLFRNNTTSESAKKIKKNNEFPFFNEYNDESYIVSHDSRKLISLWDSPKSGKSGTGKGNYILDNDLNHEIVVYRIDNGIISITNGNKCDYGIYTENKNLILIELKGGAVNDAVTQMNSTITQLITIKSIECNAVHGRVITSRTPCPNIMHSYTFNLKKRLKELNGSLRIQTRQLKEKISEL